MTLKTRLSKLEQAAMPSTLPLVIAEDAPDAGAQIARATKHGRTVIVVNEVDARL